MPSEIDQQPTPSEQAVASEIAKLGAPELPKPPSRLRILLRNAVFTVVALATALDNTQNVVQAAQVVAHQTHQVTHHLGHVVSSRLSSANPPVRGQLRK